MTTAAEHLAQPFGSVPALIRAHARDQPDKPAIICEGRTLTYAELDRLVDRAAAALQRDGARPGGAVAICSGPSERYVALYLAAVRAGLAAVPLAPGGTPEQLAAMVADSGAGLLAVDSRADVGPVAAPRLALDDGGHATGWSDWLAAEGATPEPVEPDPDLAFNIIYSSGTTGTPKGIVQSQAMRWRQQVIAEKVGFGDAVTLTATPLYSNTTLVSLLPTLSWGGTVALLPRFDAAAFLDLAESARATHTMLVPVQYRRLMAEPSFDSQRPVRLSGQDLHLGALLRRAEAAGAGPLAGQADRVLRHDGGRRLHRAGVRRASRQARHRRPPRARPRHPPDRRGRGGGADGAGGRGGRPVGRDDDRLSRAGDQDGGDAVARRPTATPSSAMATSGGSTRTGS